MKITEFDLKWVHMARYELILKLDGALWLTIIFDPPQNPQRVKEKSKGIQKLLRGGGPSMHRNK